MLSIRMQRLGRKGHPMYRVVVQDSRRTPTSGKYVAMLGSYDPHNKTAVITKDKAELYLKNGAQPSDRVVKLFKSEKVSLPKWVIDPAKQKRAIRNPDKLRKNRPSDAKALEDKPAEEKSTEPAATASAETEQAEEVKAEGTTASEEATEIAAETKPIETEPKAEEVEKDESETKTPPNEDEFPEDKQDEADKPEAPAEKA